MKKILDTEMCKINLTSEGYQVLILSEKSGWIEHNPFPGDLKGLVNALDIAMNVVSGKIWIRGNIGIQQATEMRAIEGRIK